MKAVEFADEKLPPKESVYRLTVIELVRRGYGFTEAKRMVKASGLLDGLDGRNYFIRPAFRDMDDADCADFVIEKTA